ncbi:MAG: hypothetical protein ACP5NF_11820, partial [Thermoanaerobaculum sp.]
ARDYDAQVGRWTGKGPLLFADLGTSGVGSLYAYATDSPTSEADPLGLYSFRFSACRSLKSSVKDACALVKKEKCKKALQEAGVFDCMMDACKDKPNSCPVIDCTDKVNYDKCGTGGPCEVWINMRLAASCNPVETLFHEFLHHCGLTDHDDPRFKNSMLKCVGVPY